MRTDRAPAFHIGTLLLAVGCVQSTPLPVIGPSPSPVPPATTVVKVVPAEMPFTVQLETELSSVTARAGDPFRTRLVTPLEGNDGDTIVETDAELVGLVVSVRSAPSPAILLRFNAVETRWGPRVLHATLTRAQPQASIVGDRSQFVGYDGTIEPAPGIPLLTSQDEPATAEAIDLPPGARLRMVLIDPLVISALEPNVPFAPPSP
jgi:hypothetical protein